MAGVVAALDNEFVVRRTRLPRITPCPSWNGVLGCSQSADGALVSVLSECGRVYLLRLNANRPSPTSFEFEDALDVAQVLESDAAAVMSMCHAWTRRGDVLAVARDRQLTIYHRRIGSEPETDPALFEVRSTVILRFAAASLDVLEDETGHLLLTVGCAAGVMVLTACADGSAAASSRTIAEEVAVAITKFSPDGEHLAVGTIDGRVMILRRTGATFSSMDSTDTFSKVLAAPRVTSVTFSPTSDRVIATTRKGNVYVFVRDACHQRWTLDDTFATLVANPKGGAASQTLSCWWGSHLSDSATPIFALAGRSSSSTLEFYDLYSRSLLHTLHLRGKSTSNGAARGADVTVAAAQDTTYLHIMGIVCVPSSSNPLPRTRLVCIDSDACLTSIEWPFLEFACPQ